MRIIFAATSFGLPSLGLCDFALQETRTKLPTISYRF